MLPVQLPQLPLSPFTRCPTSSVSSSPSSSRLRKTFTLNARPSTALQMQPFVYNALPARVIFGWGTVSKVAEEVKRLGCVRSRLQTLSVRAKLTSNADCSPVPLS